TKTGSTLTGLPQKTIVEFVFPVPNIEEQDKIAGCLDKLDNTITLHQREPPSTSYNHFDSFEAGYFIYRRFIC
nr:restriction endonuclease subunit S [Saccharofermentans sp.]